MSHRLTRTARTGGSRHLLRALGLCVAVWPGVHAQTLNNGAALSFGAFTAGSGGTIQISSGGGRSKTGGVLLVTQGGSPAAAQFTVTGTPNAVFTISLPVDGTVLLSDGGGNTMALNSFVSSPNGVGTLSGGGSQLINVGASLTVSNQQVSGAYSGSFSVTVNYQ